MVDWTKSMQQFFEYYLVNPKNWKDDKKLNHVTSCSITRDLSADTLGSASINMDETIVEAYFRAYLITIQNGVKEKHPLGTYLIQTPSTTYDGKLRSTSMDAYTPLLELKEGLPPIGYSLLKGDNIMKSAYMICRDSMRAPVVQTECSETLYNDFVSNGDDNWLAFNRDLIANAKYRFGLDELGRVIFEPKQELESLQPVYTYDDSNSSILYSDITVSHDIYKVPNVVEVIYSDSKDIYYARVVNDDPNSPVSTVNRGREILHRDTRPKLSGVSTRAQIEEYAERLLKELSKLQYTVSYKHGYCPVRLGDCVRLNYKSAGLTDIKARVISQNIKCEPGCPVSEKAVFTKNLWR